MHKPKRRKKNKIEQENLDSNLEQPSMPYAQSSSMVEEAEIGGSGSCVTECDSRESSREIDALEIKDEPMVKKALELFEAKKMTIQSKI